MTSETFLDGRVAFHWGDCLEVLKSLPDNSVDSCVSDPPYHLTSIVKRFGTDDAAEAKSGKSGIYKRQSGGFMGKQWDGGDIAFRPEVWRECLRVLKPGGYLLAFASTRGFGRMSVAISEAGFVTHPLTSFITKHPDAHEFLASLDGKQTDAFLQLLDHNDLGGILGWVFGSGFPKATRIKAEGYDGFRYGGQALKPAIEPIYMGQKPFAKGLSGTENIIQFGTGAVNIGGCRVAEQVCRFCGHDRFDHDRQYGCNNDGCDCERFEVAGNGRWPANLIHDGSADVLHAFPETASGEFLPHHQAKGKSQIGTFDIRDRSGEIHPSYGDSGSAARFFYQAKADSDDRIGSRHPTVKPVDLMQYLVRLVTPPGGTVLDHFAGTGTTGEAAWREGFNAILIEREQEYQTDIRERMRLCMAGPDERKREITKRKGLTADDAGPLFGGSDMIVAGGATGLRTLPRSGRTIGPVGLKR